MGYLWGLQVRRVGGRKHKKWKNFILILRDTGSVMLHGRNQRWTLDFIGPHDTNEHFRSCCVLGKVLIIIHSILWGEEDYY